MCLPDLLIDFLKAQISGIKYQKIFVFHLISQKKEKKISDHFDLYTFP
jgi:hypothetical protein